MNSLLLYPAVPLPPVEAALSPGVLVSDDFTFLTLSLVEDELVVLVLVFQVRTG